MYYVPYGYHYQYPYYVTNSMYNDARQIYYPYPNMVGYPNYLDYYRSSGNELALQDYGPNPLVININEATLQNQTFRTALWTGTQLQLTLMSLNPGEDIGLEMHPDVDQFLRVEQGQGIVQMGASQDNLSLQRNVQDDDIIIIPAGTFHNLTNTGTVPLKLYSIYAPPNHPFGTVHATKAEALAAEED